MYISAIILALAIALSLPIFLLYGIHYGLNQSQISEQKQKMIMQRIIVIMMLWLVIPSALSMIDFFDDLSQFPPRLILVLVPLIFLCLFLSMLPGIRKFLQYIPPQWLIGLQFFRVPVEIFLWLLYETGTLPIQMTFEGHNFDILTGLSAPLIVYLCFKKNWPGWVAIVWNMAGIGLVFNIMTIAIFSMPTPFRYYMNEPTNTFVTEFPFILLPAVMVVSAYGLHFMSLSQLMYKPRS